MRRVTNRNKINRIINKSQWVYQKIEVSEEVLAKVDIPEDKIIEMIQVRDAARAKHGKCMVLKGRKNG